MRELWRRLPVLVRAVLTGGAVAIAGTGPWALLSGANLKYLSSVPWSVPPTALYLWFFWRYLQGAGWPRTTANARRAGLRANRLSDDVWGAALFAGVLGLVSVVLLLRVMSRLVVVQQQQLSDLSLIPVATLLAILLMSAVVAGVVEEAAFRGYMQGAIERRHGPVVAILVTGTLFGFLHFTHPEVTLALMPYFLAVAAVYGALTYLTNSILPAMVLHAGGNFLSGLGVLAGGADLETPASAPLIWETGPTRRSGCLAPRCSWLGSRWSGRIPRWQPSRRKPPWQPGDCDLTRSQEIKSSGDSLVFEKGTPDLLVSCE